MYVVVALMFYLYYAIIDAFDVCYVKAVAELCCVFVALVRVLL